MTLPQETNLSRKHFDSPVPHYEKKMMRFYEVGRRLGLPMNKQRLIDYLVAKKIPGLGRSTLDEVVAPRAIKAGNIIQHKAIVETYMGEGSWPFPEYYDLQGRGRDEDLSGFHAAVDEVYKITRFQARKDDESNRHIECDSRYLSAGLKYETGKNSLCFDIVCDPVECEGGDQHGFELVSVATLRAKDLTIEIWSEGAADCFLTRLENDQVSSDLERPWDHGRRYFLSAPKQLDIHDAFRAKTPWLSYIRPSEDQELLVEIRSGRPKIELNAGLIKKPEDRNKINKIVKAHLENILSRPQGGEDPFALEQTQFPIYRMSYEHYEIE